MYTVMTVCTGNICRSPMAEIILRAEFERRGLDDKVNVESSGVSDEEYGIRSTAVPSRYLRNAATSCHRTISRIASRATKSNAPTCSCR